MYEISRQACARECLLYTTIGLLYTTIGPAMPFCLLH